MASVRELRERVQTLKGERNKAEALVASTKNQLRDVRKQLRWVEKALVIVQTVAQITQKELQFHISSLGTSCIQAVFEDDIELVVEFVTRRDKIEADINFSEGGILRDPLYGGGFGLADIGSFALRASLWGLQKNKVRNILILDEPFRHLKDQSKQMQDKARNIMQGLSRELGLQFIVIEHDPAISEGADTVFSLRKAKNGCTTINKI